MSDLEQVVFEQLSPWLATFLKKSVSPSFLDQKKLESRLETVLLDLTASLLLFFDRYHLGPTQSRQLAELCVAALQPLVAEGWLNGSDGQALFDQLYPQRRLPEAVRSADLEVAYAHLFPPLANFYLSIQRTLTEWGAHPWPENEARLEQALTQLQKELLPPARMESNPPRGAETSISFDISLEPEAGIAPDEDVAFTALYPREIGVELWNTLLVYTHLASALDRVRQDAERFKDELTGAKEVTVPASTRLARGTEISLVPVCEGLTFNPQRVTLAWLEDVQRAEFRFRAAASLADDAARGRVDVYVGPLIVASLKLAVLVGATAPQATQPEQTQAQLYQQDDIFISYSHKDTEVVLAFKKAYEALGENVLIDIDTLRSGQEWNAELLKMIERAEIFQLFWSANSSQSKYCQQEWEYALKLNRGAGFIRPCYWATPLPPPPETLGHLHFEFVQL
jgi:hypothetical protein